MLSRVSRVRKAIGYPVFENCIVPRTCEQRPEHQPTNPSPSRLTGVGIRKIVILEKAGIQGWGVLRQAQDERFTGLPTPVSSLEGEGWGEGEAEQFRGSGIEQSPRCQTIRPVTGSSTSTLSWTSRPSASRVRTIASRAFSGLPQPMSVSIATSSRPRAAAAGARSS